MLHVHRAERADRLVAALARVIAAEPLDDPLEPEVVSVHSRGIERWIAQELSGVLGASGAGGADGDGVCANVEFPFPATLIRGAVASASGSPDPDRDPWLPERLTWPLLELVEERDDPRMLGPLRAHLAAGGPGAGSGGSSRRLGAVRHVADLFDRYGVHRPGMILRWRAGDDSGPAGGNLDRRHRWQPLLWRALRDRVDGPSFAERHADALRALRRDRDVLALPDRIALFGLTAIPASYLEVLAAIACHRDVHLMLLHPSPALWDGVAAHAGPAGQHLWTRDDDPTRALARNPLLRSWGRDVRELQLVAPVPDDPAGRHHHPTAQEPPTSLLARIQHDIRADRFRSRNQAAQAGGDPRPALDPDDRSLQVHDCHGQVRQVEVLREAILHLLADDPTLEPRDIIVMCPDIETFAPLVTAVFGADAVRPDGAGPAGGAPPALRVRLADRSIRRTNPVLEVVSSVLDLVDGRTTASGVLDLIAREPVRRRFDLDDDGVATLESWVASLQIRWGLDAAHRRRNGLPELHANTWRAGLERLHLGIAMADEDLRLLGGVAPFDGVEGSSSELAGVLAEVVERLDAVARDMARPQPVDGWRRAIGAAADALTATAPGSGWQRLQLHRILDDIVDEATTGGATSSVELTLGEVRRLLDDRLGGRPTSTGHRSGDLTVCTLVPMRSVPHRVVCLLGLDDGVFPRQGVPDSDDLLQQAPRVGDRDPRSEDRQLLLDALLAATGTLVITYAGRDERTNEPRPPAVPVDELLDLAERTVSLPGGESVRERLVTLHPLQVHDRRSFQPGRLGTRDRPWSFAQAALDAALAAAGEQHPAPAFLDRELPPPDGEVIALDDLVRFLQHPVREFVRQRLDVRLPGPEEQPSDAIPSSLKGLEAWQVGEELLASWRAGRDLDRALEVVQARGLVPPGGIADGDLETVRTRVAKIVRLCEHLGVEPATPRRSVDVEIDLPDGRQVTGSVPDVAGARFETVSYSRVKPKQRLAAWAHTVALTASDPGPPWSALTVGRHAYKGGDRAQAVRVPERTGAVGDPRAAAIEQLLRLVDLYDRGMRAPLPLYCESSHKAADQFKATGDPTRFVDTCWETKPYRGFDQEDRDPYHLLVLGGQVPTDALFGTPCRDDQERSWADHGSRFVAYAWRLWEPILHAEKPVDA